MASTPLALVLLTLTSFLFLLTPQTQAQKTPTAPAPAPAGPVNLTGILDKGGQYTTFIRLLNETQQITPIESQLNNTSEGFTVFAPTDNAFQNLQSGAINDLTDQQKVQLVLYHIAPKYYSLSDLQTVSNPVRTQASGKDGTWGLNFTAQGNQLNVSSGVVATPINNALRQQFPLAVYQVDKVLLPLELFRAKSPASAPSPQPSKSTPSNHSSGNTGNGGGAPSPSNNSQKRDAPGRNVGFGLVLGLGFICMGALS